MDAKRSFGTICDGKIQIELLQSADLEEAVKVMDAFFAKEAVCLALEINLPESEKAREEFRALCREIAGDGITLVARHIQSNEIVAVAFNKLHILPQTSDEACLAEDFKDNYCHTPNMQEAMSYLLRVEGGINIFEKFETDSFVELMFLATRPEFEGKKIGRTLCMYTIELARQLGSGIGNDMLSEDVRDKRPKVVTAVFTSKFSQRIGEHLGFELLKRVPYTDLFFKGKAYAENIGPMHPASDFVVKKLF